MTISDLQEFSHRRCNPLIGEWVQVSPHRGKRPWQGQLEKTVEEIRLSYDPSCYLCPGNKRSGGFHNPDYAAPYSFVNDFSALIEDKQDGTFEEGLLLAKAERGICKVVCFSPWHDVTLPEMTIEQISGVVSLWIKEFRELGSKPFINYVQIFENKGAIMGCSNPHPHGQIWAQQSMPVEPAKKQRWQEKYFNKKGTTLLFDYILQEKKAKSRVVTENNHFMVLVPFWAVWPYETMIVPKRAMAHIDEMNNEEQMQFASTLKELTTRYDNLFEVSFPYSAGIHQAPTDGLPHPEWHWHMVFYPPLLRSAVVKKFMVGYEMLANPQRDITPEVSAEQLRSVSTVHFKEKNKAWVH
jgi:UDPglucose--hexose-1-phosphate uridylyltransferase